MATFKNVVSLNKTQNLDLEQREPLRYVILLKLKGCTLTHKQMSQRMGVRMSVATYPWIPTYMTVGRMNVSTNKTDVGGLSLNGLLTHQKLSTSQAFHAQRTDNGQQLASSKQTTSSIYGIYSSFGWLQQIEQILQDVSLPVSFESRPAT